MPKKVAIVGGGIAGLTAAYQMVKKKADLSITLFEGSDRLGGALQTIHRDGFLIENSGDMFVSDPSDAIELCSDLGMAQELIATNTEDRFSSIVRDAELVRIPAGFSLMLPGRLSPILKSPLLSFSGKLRFMLEYFSRPQKSIGDESLRSFATRHFGRETFERMIQPLVAGIYSARAEELSVDATMKRFVDLQNEHGSLIRAARRQRSEPRDREASGARYGMFVAPKHGMQSVVDRLSDNLPGVDIRKQTRVDKINRDDSGWSLNVTDETYDAVILATGAAVAAGMLPSGSSLHRLLNSIAFGSMIVVTVACNESCFQRRRPRGFGFVVPEVEGREFIACSFASNKFPGRAPSGKMLLRCFIGGRRVENWKRSSDSDLIEMVNGELSELLGFAADNETQFDVFRWLDCMPQYRVGHLDLMAKIKAEVAGQPGLAVAGSSYEGVGIPACIASGRLAADQAISSLSDN